MRILYIDFDSLRPDHLGCYGYKAESGRETSPNIDAIAREGVVFREYYTRDAPCLHSRTAFYSGSDVSDPLWTVIREGGPYHAQHAVGRSPLPRYLERLEATVRGEGAAALRKKYAAYL